MPGCIALPTTRATLESRQRNSPSKISPLLPPRSTLEAISRRQECSSQDSRRSGAPPTWRTISTIPLPQFSCLLWPGVYSQSRRQMESRDSYIPATWSIQKTLHLAGAHYRSGRHDRISGFRSLTLLVDHAVGGALARNERGAAGRAKAVRASSTRIAGPIKRPCRPRR